MIVDSNGMPINPNRKDLDPKEVYSPENMERMRENEQRRRGQWFSNYGPTVTNIGSISGTLKKPLDTPPFMMLRQVSRESLIDRAILSRRSEDIKSLSRRVVVAGKQKGWRVVHKKFDDPNFDSSTREIHRRCREMEALLESPMKTYHKTFRDFLSVSVQEELILDRKAMILRKDNRGRPIDYYLLPGDTILPVLYVIMPWMAKRGISNERVARMILSEEYSQKAGISIDITDAAYVQEVDGQVVGAWKDDEIDVEWTNPSGELNRWGFGTSVLEQSLQATGMLLNMINFNKDMFKPGFPNRMLIVSGDYSAEGLSSFERQILGQGGAGSPRSKMPVLPGPADMRAQVLDLTNTPNDMQFEQFFRMMSAIKCSFFGMHPSRLNLSDRGPEGFIMGSGSATGEVSQSVNEEGLYSILESISDWLTRTLIHPYYEDLTLIFDGIYEESEAAVLQSLQIESSWSTKNEIRARRNLRPLGELEGGDVINDGIWLQWVNLKQQQAQQAQAQQQYEQGDFGQGQLGQQGAPQQGGDAQQAAMMQQMAAAQQQQGAPQGGDAQQAAMMQQMAAAQQQQGAPQGGDAQQAAMMQQMAAAQQQQAMMEQAAAQQQQAAPQQAEEPPKPRRSTGNVVRQQVDEALRSAGQ